MPIPKPKAGESRQDFVARCTESASMVDDFPDGTQRTAVCLRVYEDSGKSIEGMDHKFCALEVKATDNSGTVTGYGSVFGNEDLGGDIVEKGAFDESLKTKMPLMLWSHDFFSPPIGKWTSAKEDDRGLLLEGKLFVDASEDIRQIHHGLKEEAITGLSIGFYPIVHEWDDDEEVRRIKKVSLEEVSFVNFPMNQEARVESVKNFSLRRGDTPQPKQIEKILRDVGFSKSMARAFMAEGFKGIGRCDAEPEEMAEAIRQFATANPFR